ncbi:targeting protein for Xklp2 protein (macronuclear) [Tetrahymena thermophila SB210]|uniref:Targeting protein for Xklp2 protein n=1 Tax=Tetrahymena thermophila (strain SB210) TaxID=312017 RepID=I7LTY3_TETTS|nr:targeting protein for Xklp2 protein [Tetrahymena thermophila SB210]EAR87518.2 targeting protein for Xklp2 protein [Tetrahymena thermophila SB210]|eukprot:XP_001007763.2 targeting protein for Xklp2 protein [Tetrahymena thermophila SB210]
MDLSDKNNLFDYLSKEEHINPQKRLFGDDDEDDVDKENKFKFSKLKDESGQLVNFQVEKEQNQSLCGSNLSDTKSFYRANGFSKIEIASEITSSLPRDQLLKDWQEKKSVEKSGSKSNVFSERKNNLLSSVEKQKPEYLSQAQLIEKYFNSRVGYGDGKVSAPVKTTTKPQSPKFQTTQRSIIHSLRNKQMEEMESMNNSKNSAKKIDPKNFFLETEKRARSRPQTPIKEDEEFVFKARPKPDDSLKFEIKKVERNPIQFTEFRLNTEQRGRSKEQQLQLKLENEKKQEELQRHFHAQEIPDYSELSQKYANYSCGSPKPTLPMEFKFETEKRSEFAQKRSQFSQSAEKYEFKARKVPDFSKIRSPNKPSPKKATVPVEIKLQSTLRAEERKLFDEKVEFKMQQEMKEYIDENQKAKEDEEEEALRKQAQFKAQPVRKYRQVEIHKSEIPLTQPQSPKFRTDQRLRSTEKSQEFL